MPCNSDYLEPTRKEEELQRAAKLLVYVSKQIARPIAKFEQEAAGSIYARSKDGQVRDLVPRLCSVLTRLNDGGNLQELLSAQNRTARDLANWWEEHLEADRDRELSEAIRKRQLRLRKRALAKLTITERRALGV